MSSLSLIRSYIETRVAAAFPGVTIVYQNVQETPPNFPYVICLINYPSTTEPVICQTESMVEQLRGNLQLSCYVDRGLGMKALEAMGVQAMTVMNNMYEWDSPVRVRCGQIIGPESILGGAEPYAVATISCPFNALV